MTERLGWQGAIQGRGLSRNSDRDRRPLGFVLLIIFGMAITWARAGGTNGKFVARVGLLAGLFGIVLQAIAT
jgi:hypothetical protein